MDRREILQGMGAIGGTAVIPGIAFGKQNTYKTHKTDHTLKRIGTQIAFHDAQSRAAFISAAFEKGIELYVAEGVREKDDVPSAVYQITTDSVGGVYNPTWERGNRLSFQRNLSRYSLKIPPSYKVLEHKMEKENVVDVERTLENATRVEQ